MSNQSHVENTSVENQARWPWGVGEHRDTRDRSWCFGCSDWCYEPTGLALYDLLCRCCTEPLYQLRIAELEAELARFHECSSFQDGPAHNHVFQVDDQGDPSYRSHPVWHKDKP